MIYDSLGFGAVFKAGCVFCPLDADVLNELGVQFFGCRAAFSPVQNKLRHCSIDKTSIYTAAGHYLQRID